MMGVYLRRDFEWLRHHGREIGDGMNPPGTFKTRDGALATVWTRNGMTVSTIFVCTTQADLAAHSQSDDYREKKWFFVPRAALKDAEPSIDHHVMDE